jgi:hypothetical protein
VTAFLWLGLKVNILTKDVLSHRVVNCEKVCFYEKNVSVSHLVFLCPLDKYVWNILRCTFGINCHFVTIDRCISVRLKGFGKRK